MSLQDRLAAPDDDPDAFDRGLRNATLLSLGFWALLWLVWRWWAGR